MISTKEQLINAANAVFFEEGFEKLTFAKIAKKAGISQPAVYHHFNNKEDLLSECCLFAAAKGREFIDSFIDAKEDAASQLRSYVEGNLRWVTEKPADAYSIVSLYYFSKTNANLLRIYQGAERAGVERISVYLVRGSFEGHWKVKKPDECALKIRNYLAGEMLHAFYAGTKYSAPYLKSVYLCIEAIVNTFAI